MSNRIPGAGAWVTRAVSLGFLVLIGQALPRAEETIQDPAEQTSRPDTAGTVVEQFRPPPESAIPDDPFGMMIRMGKDIFQNTGVHARRFVGNDLRCSNCHLDGGRLPDSAPLWAAYENYPAYRSKNRHVNTFAERLQGCFRYSMNGKAPPLGDPVLVALESYAFFLARGAQTGVSPPGRGYPKLGHLSRSTSRAEGTSTLPNAPSATVRTGKGKRPRTDTPCSRRSGGHDPTTGGLA